MGESLGLRPHPVPLGRDHAIPIATFVRCGATVAASKERMRMARKPNYRFERMERQRTKAAKKAARAKAKAEKVEKRRAEKAGQGEPTEQPTEQALAEE